MSTIDQRPLRKDAERNRQLILDAAQELFAQRGLAVTLNDIAHHAGVGVGTVYRRFPDKPQLIAALFEQKLEELVAILQKAVADPDPWRGLVGFLEQALDLQACDFGLKDLLLNTPQGLEHIGKIRSRLMPLGVELVRRAHEAGQLRADIEAQDMPLIQLMVSNVIDGARDVQPELWRRYLQIIVQGLRADPAPPEPLAYPPLSHEAVDVVMSTAKLGRR